ncbi:MAG: DNA sulfur modification protein DndD [Acidobacteria bacterium]|nr:DNA sulfur modification protein DndD [Acidobacteriota bacterium]
MILEQLTLRNFCVYEGEQVFDLTPARRGGQPAPIVLFGGINGGGKTTLLDAVQLVLYGNRARCSKRSNKPYDAFLQESVHQGAEPSDGAAIRLSFRYAAEGEEHLYEVTRAWSLNGKGRICERVQVRTDGDLDGWLSDNWNQLVEDFIPFGIAQLCFFDAEKIRFLAEDETSTQALGEAIKSLLGLDLAERLVADSLVLEARIVNRVPKSRDLQGVEQLEKELNAKQNEIDRLVQELGALENPRETARNRLKQAENLFAKVGGRHWEQREARQREVGELEHALHETKDRLIALAATELPLALVPDLLREVTVQADRERQVTERRLIVRLLADRDDRLLSQLRERRTSSKAVQLVQRLMETDREDRCIKLDVEERLKLSDAGKRMLDHLLGSGLTERLNTATDLLDVHNHGQRALEEVQRALAVTPKEDLVRDVAQELKEASTELANFDHLAERREKRLAGLRAERDEIRNQLHCLRRSVIDEQLQTEEDARLASLLVRTQETMKAFLQRATAQKIDRLSELITESFRYLLRKKRLVERVLIDPRDFTIAIYDSTGRPISKQRLSEGEKQIFAVSVLWGLSRASARPLPAIIDTPMARLDAKHRDRVVKRYFPHASYQVIVLSTDTEVERRYLHDLQPHIARAYHLNYNEHKKVTVAEEGYFWDAVPFAAIKEATV